MITVRVSLLLQLLHSTEPVAYYGARNNPGAVLEVGPYQDYNNPRNWNDNLIAFPYPTSEITKAGGLYKQVPR